MTAYAAGMGSSNPWSPDWRPDASGTRLATIRAARRGALVAALVYLPVGAVAALFAHLPLPEALAASAVVVGLPGVALLGAGLAPATLGATVDAVVAGIAFAIGAPVAAVTSVLIGGWLLSLIAAGDVDLAGPILRTGVLAALGVAPGVGLAAAIWVTAVRRLRPRPASG